MSDFEDVLTRTALDCDILRLRPSAYVQIFTSGTATQVWEGVTDALGHFAVPTLATGKYDLKVDGALVKTFHHVTHDHTHNDQTWIMSRLGAIGATKNEDSNCAVFSTGVAGKIVKLAAVAELVAPAGDVTIHLLKGAATGTALLTCASNSSWNRRFYNSAGFNKYRYAEVDANPDISVAANEAVTMGAVYAVTGVEGLTLLAVFRPT